MNQDTSTLGKMRPTVCDHKWVPLKFRAIDHKLIQVGCPAYETIQIKCVECGEVRDIEESRR